jgi:DNA-binding PadR family transcriptional regulator
LSIPILANIILIVNRAISEVPGGDFPAYPVKIAYLKNVERNIICRKRSNTGIIRKVKSKTMLSRTALFVLGIIGSGPINPYAIVGLVNERRRSLRQKIHAQTIYGIVNTLRAKKLIVGKKMTNGNMPNKTIYSITDKGQELIKNNLISYLSTPEDNLSEMALSMILVGYLDKQTVLKALKEYRDKAGKEITIRKNLGSFDITEGAYVRQITLEHTLNILEVNYKTANQLIKRIEKDGSWGNFSVPWWRDDLLKTGSQKGRKSLTPA